MSMDWMYDLPNWVYGLCSILLFNAVGATGLYITRVWVRRQHLVDHSHNDIVSHFLAGIAVFYGITLGLLAVSAWTNYSNVEAKVNSEAQVLASLHRDANGYPEPTATDVRKDLEAYTLNVIKNDWQQQRKGVVVEESPALDRLQDDVTQFKPATSRDQIIDTEVFKQFNVLVEARRARMNSVTTHMPHSLWTLVILGSLITISVTLLFDAPSFNMHLWLTLSLATLLGLMIFLIGTLDSPFRGRDGVSSAPLVRVYNSWSQ